MPGIVWSEITYPFLNFNGGTGWNYLSIPKLQRLHRWCLGMDKLLHPTLYNGGTSLSMLGLKLNNVSKRGYWDPIMSIAYWWPFHAHYPPFFTTEFYYIFHRHADWFCVFNKCLVARLCKAWKAGILYLELSDRSKIWQACHSKGVEAPVKFQSDVIIPKNDLVALRRHSFNTR